MPKVFVFGWYGKANLGDEIFKICFSHLWPNVCLTFGNLIPDNINTDYDALWIGGGSFLEQPIPKIDTVNVPIYFIGVGGCPSPAECNQKALDRSKFAVCRDPIAFRSNNTIVASDLVFSRKDLKPLHHQKKKQIAVFLNDFITPRGSVYEWKFLSFYWFLQEFSKILDRYAEQGYTIKLLPMCINNRIDDRRIAGAIQGRSAFPNKYEWILEPLDELDLRTEISESEFVISQRFHGLVYSIIEQRPCVTLSIHSKFNSLSDTLKIPSVDYYGLTDVKFKDVFDRVMNMSFDFSEYILSSQDQWSAISNCISCSIGTNP